MSPESTRPIAASGDVAPMVPTGPGGRPHLTCGVLMAAVAVVIVHGPEQTRDRISAALIAAANALDPTPVEPEPEGAPE